MPSKAPIQYLAQNKLLNDFGNRLRLARLRRKFSALLVAERADISRQTLVKVEKGDASVTLGTYLRVMAVLGFDSDIQHLLAEDTVGIHLVERSLPVRKRAPKKLQ